MITLVAIYKNVPFQVNPAVNIFGQPLENLGYFSFQHLVTLNKTLWKFPLVYTWRSLVDGDNGCIGPSGKLLC